MSQIEHITIAVYGQVLKLYPDQFRLNFGDEMQMVFSMALTDAARHSSEALFGVVARELRDLPVSLIREHRRERVQRRNMTVAAPTSARQVWRARLLTRLVGAVLSLFILSTLIPDPSKADNPVSPHQTLFFGLLFMTCISMLVALRWERAGGILTMTGGFSLGLFLAIYLHAIFNPEFSLIGTMLIGTLWMLPFVILGALFYKLGWHKVRTAQVDYSIG